MAVAGLLHGVHDCNRLVTWLVQREDSEEDVHATREIVEARVTDVLKRCGELAVLVSSKGK